MQSIGEMIRYEQSIADSQLRAIAESYANAFMDASTPIAEVKQAEMMFNGRTRVYEESQQEIERFRNHQKLIVGRLALVAHPDTNVHFAQEKPPRDTQRFLSIS
jgi:hypothetical protein